MDSTVSPHMEPFSVAIDLARGAMIDPTNRIVRRASDMRGYYADEQAVEDLIRRDDDPLHYEVHEVPVPAEQGHLMYCVSILNAGRIGDECFMTKGHYHEVAGTAELYLCLRGEGLMLMKAPDKGAVAEAMRPGKMVYVPPFWAHRSVNTGREEPLVSFCAYPAEAGHNYGDIQDNGFGKRVFERSGRIEVEEG